MTKPPLSLLNNLAKTDAVAHERTDGKLSFTDALATLNIQSVFDIVRRSKSAFVRDISRISDANAALAYENARCYATQIVRLYRNQLVSSGRTQKLTRRSGVRSLLEIGPSFPNLFKENWDLFCKVGAIEAKDSPVAYLTSLYRFALEELEGSSVDSSRIKLDERRPDLKDLIVDQQSTFTPVPTLQIVNQVLGKAIEAYVDTVAEDKDKSLYQLVAEKQHPFMFPYNFHFQQITLGLAGKKPTLGELSYHISLEVPTTSTPTDDFGKVQQSSAVAQALMSGLGPEQQAIALEPAVAAEPEAINRFFNTKYNIVYVDGASNQLNTLDIFMAKTDLDSDAVEALLATGSHTPYRSANIQSAGQTADATPSPDESPAAIGTRFGAEYVNGPAVEPAMGLLKEADGVVRLTNTSVDRFDRLQRMIRLQRWMNIPFTTLDTLIIAVIRSEGDANSPGVLTANTLRALGVYRYLSKHYNLTPEEFASIFHCMAGEASDGRLPLFDRVFNNPILFDTPLVLNGSPLYLDNESSEHIKARAQLSAALHLSSTQEGLWLLVVDTRDLLEGTSTDFKLKLSMVSSLYRQTRIASMFGLTVQDSRALIDLLGGEPYRANIVKGRLGSAPAETDSDAEPDVLDILMQLDWAVTWLKAYGQNVATLRRQLGVDMTEPATSQELAGQLEQLTDDALAVALTDQQLASLNLPTYDDEGSVIEWWAVIAPLIDSHGLVVAQPLDEEPAVSIRQAILTQLTSIRLGDSLKSELAAKLEVFVFNGYLTQHRLMEGLMQTVAGLPLDRCEPVLRWSGSSVDVFLGSLMEGTEVKLTELMRHAEVNQQLGLSAQALRTFLINPHWLHTGFDSPLPLSLSSLYLLDRYRNWRDQSGHPEDALLDYFKQANGGSKDKAHCAALLAALTHWTSSEVLAATVLLTASDEIASSMHEVDWLNRMHSASELTGLSAGQLLLATDLTVTSPATQWKSTGEAVISGNR